MRQREERADESVVKKRGERATEKGDESGKCDCYFSIKIMHWNLQCFSMH
jgi:hypothetical protein